MSATIRSGVRMGQAEDSKAFADSLFKAIEAGDVEAVRGAIASGKLSAAAEPRSMMGLTPLMTAVRENRVEIARALLPVSDAKALSEQGHTALAFSVKRIKTGFVDEALFDLLLPVSDARQADKEGFTPLHWAAESALACQAGKLAPLSDVNAQSKKERVTPLMKCFEGHPRGKAGPAARVVEILAPISNLEVADQAGMTALDFADSANSHEGWDAIASLTPTQRLKERGQAIFGNKELPRLTAALEAAQLAEAVRQASEAADAAAPSAGAGGPGSKKSAPRAL